LTETAAEGEHMRSAQIVGSTQYGAGVADTDVRIDSLKDDIRALSYSVLDLQEKGSAHDAKFAQILVTLSAHGAKLDSHDGRFDQIDTLLAEILTRLPQRPQ